MYTDNLIDNDKPSAEFQMADRDGKNIMDGVRKQKFT